MDQAPPAEHHYLLRYAKTGDARYLSLHDVRRLLAHDGAVEGVRMFGRDVGRENGWQ